jgi:polyhydroxyalkanoate synthesis regulator phasin
VFAVTVAEQLAELSEGDHVDIALESGETLSVYVAEIKGEVDGLTATATQTITCKTLEGRTFRAATEFHAHTDETRLLYTILQPTGPENSEFVEIVAVEPSSQQTLMPDGGQLVDRDNQTAEQIADEQTIKDLQAEIQSVRETQQAIRESSIKPRIERLQERANQAAQERDALAERVDGLEELVAQLRAELGALAGLADDQDTNPDKRAADLAHVLIRRANARDGTAAMWWKEVRDTFEDLGHGQVSKPDCYKAMDDVADRDGFAETKKHSPDSGQRVQAVKVELDALNTAGTSRNPTTSELGPTPESAVSEVINHSDE